MLDDWLEIAVVFDEEYARAAGGSVRAAEDKARSAIKYMRTVFREELCLDVKLTAMMYFDRYPFPTRHSTENEFLDNMRIYFNPDRRRKRLGYPDVVSND